MATKTPMLATKDLNGNLELLDKLKLWPLLGSFKIDGIRAMNVGGQLQSRTWTKIRSGFAQWAFGGLTWDGLDGELVVRDVPPGDTLYHASESAVMTHGDIRPLKWMVFDAVHPIISPDALYTERLSVLRRHLDVCPNDCIEILEQRELRWVDDVIRMEQEALDAGHEGLILRNAWAPYKWGRSTLKQGYLIKLVRLLTSEAYIVGFEEKMHNSNEAAVSATGHTKRSSAQAGEVGMDTLGAIWVQDVTNPLWKFKIGVFEGWDDKTKKDIWDIREAVLQHPPEQRMVKYKYKPCGTKDLPRQPVCQGWRKLEDM